MTEREWLDDALLKPKLTDFLQGQVTERKRRLYACAYCRRVWHLLASGPLRQAVQAGEDLADGLLSDDEMLPLRVQVGRLADPDEHSAFHACAVKWAIDEFVSGVTAAQNAREALGFSVSGQAWSHRYVKTMHREEAHQFAILRDICANPFRPVTIDPDWLTQTVTSLATAAYNERILPSGELDTARLGVLADTLEEAGCQDADILGHLRSPGPHVWGCWAVELVLGKE
jgi:hypothetical protein